MRHTILVATLSSVFASVLTTAVISGSLLGANTANSANTPGEAITVQPGGVESILQGDVDCDSDVGTRDSQGILRYVLEQPALSQDEPCPDIATVIPAGEGVPGPQGPQGEQGEPGPEGPGGLSEFQFVFVETESNTDATKSISAPCPAGKKLLSGGYQVFDADDVIVRTNAAGGGWFITAEKQNVNQVPWSVAAQAHCAVVGD